MTDFGRTAQSGTLEEVAHLGLNVGRMLLENGADTAQVQEAVGRFAAAFGCEAHLEVTYEALLLTVVSGEQFRTKVGYRVPAMNVNLAAVEGVDQVVEEVEKGRWGLAESRRELEAIEKRSPLFGRWLVVTALGLTAGSMARLVGWDLTSFSSLLPRLWRVESSVEPLCCCE